jgi:hypothetical protein
LCDAGGEGVTTAPDIITGIHPAIQLKECIPEEGSYLGAADINQRFQEFLVWKLGREPGWDIDILEEAMKDFDSIDHLRRYVVSITS